MRIGELAREAGCLVETVRYYEHEGLLPPARRDLSNNYRQYERSHLERLTFLRRCRTLDMTHSEIRALLLARAEPGTSCGSINDLVEAHLAHVEARMAELQALKGQLVELRGLCSGGRETQDCGILRELEQPSEGGRRDLPSSAGHPAGVHAPTGNGR